MPEKISNSDNTTATTNADDYPLLVLVDGSSYLFRAFHALPALANSKGEPTGAMHGVLNMLDSLRKAYDTEYVVVVFDAKGKTFRNDMYDQYKANRPPMPDDLRVQIEPLHEIIRAQGYPLVIESGVEADDVIGSLSEQYKGKVVISTGDKDMAQLVNERVSLINTMSNAFHDIEGVKEKYGVPPELIRDYLTLMGDKVDNIPGVEKVGPKTAVKWLDQYGSLQAVMDNADSFKGKIGENLRAALDHLPLSYELVTIRCDLEVDLSKGALCAKPEDKERLAELYERYGFRTRLRQLSVVEDVVAQEDATPSGDVVAAVAPKNVNYETVFTHEALQQWLDRLKQADYFAFDTETTSLNYMDAEVVGVSFSVKAGEAAYVPFGHDYEDAPEQLSRTEVLDALKPLLEDNAVKKVGQNLKYDRSVLLNHGVELKGIEHDTMLASYVLNSTASRHDMDSLCRHHLNYTPISFESIAGKGKKQLTFNQIDLEQAAPYAAEDADVTLRLHQQLWPQVEKLEEQSELYRTVELPLVKVLSTIERNGVCVDADLLAVQSGELSEAMVSIQEKSYELVGDKFNLASPKQLQSILFEKMELPVLRKTPKGQPSTAEDVLQQLAEDYELPRLILEYRSLSKLKSTYTDKLPLQINDKTGRVHTSYHQAVAATGRLSSADPNLQNIPIRTEEGRRIRQAFVAPEGRKILAVDYSQIELRIMAHLSGDDSLLEAFAQGRDVHKSTAAEVFGVGLDEVEPDQRRAAKAINFGLIYGMSAFGLAKQLHVPRGQAQEYIDLYFSRYPGVLDYMEGRKAFAKEHGYVKTLFGRRLYLPDINARNGQRRQYAERTAINAPMQGTAADIIKKAMISIDQWMGQEKPDALMIMQVHDELVFEVEGSVVENFCLKVTELMENAAKLDVPLVADSGVGSNWDQAH